MEIAWKEVASTNIAAVAHADTRLFVRFRNGAEWVYDGVDSGVYEDMLNAESVGIFFARNIRGLHPASRVDGDGGQESRQVDPAD